MKISQVSLKLAYLSRYGQPKLLWSKKTIEPCVLRIPLENKIPNKPITVSLLTEIVNHIPGVEKTKKTWQLYTPVGADLVPKEESVIEGILLFENYPSVESFVDSLPLLSKNLPYDLMWSVPLCMEKSQLLAQENLGQTSILSEVGKSLQGAAKSIDWSRGLEWIQSQLASKESAAEEEKKPRANGPKRKKGQGRR